MLSRRTGYQHGFGEDVLFFVFHALHGEDFSGDFYEDILPYGVGRIVSKGFS
ncbi:MAG: hypothetical protein IPJ81_08990 [Chitinophagaceae bacterium]|nr:hypothetical protein [Chitinophagaceae bacterium]